MLTHQIKIRRKGQMTLPAEVREDLELTDGDIIFLRKENGAYTLSVGESWVQRTRGALATAHSPIEPDELEEMIEDAMEPRVTETLGDS